MNNKMVRQSAMEMMFYYTLFVFLIFAKLTNAASDDIDEVKTRRAGTVGLFAFPRVGRGDPDMAEWDGVEALPNSVEDYDIPRTEVKRQYLVAFPRVGRSGGMRYWPKSVLKNMAKRGGGSNANGGMWFGPRLGRVQKRSSDKDNTIQENNKIHVYNPRLGRESEEVVDEYDNYADSLPSDKTILLNNQFS